MLQLAPNETILLVMRRHWYVLVKPVATFVVLMVIPPAVLVLVPAVFPLLDSPELKPVINFFLAIYLAGLLVYIFILWLDYYLDVWIITDQRIIDIEQKGLFHRQISEIAMDRVQNVTVEIPGFIPTMLKFGNIKIQTAGEGSFTISDVPNFYRAKELILKHSSRRNVPIGVLGVQ